MSVINGGGTVILFPGLDGTSSSTVNYTGYMAAVGAAYAAMSAGHATFMAVNGTGMAAFLAGLRFPTN
ncbi:hypothetical protein HHL16_15350 [Pseudoflavitalea sp. G-6-1-2]|uniref:hypothetical protein n=1 Tax=Pseudoflavitalea sp. G-6-1-2 TaxID=2728841 RepID=UPI00146A6BBE|nr:hypothetical protein [Pseudoflavitalea sp. G-6-1-2]NML22259.1 hypothetical protein [Pseudoflavitalea sp. G-6-1-2]